MTVAAQLYTDADLQEFDGFDTRMLEAMSRMVDIRDTRIKFARDHHVNTRGEKMDFANYPHIVPIYNSVAFQIVLMGSVQSMKSEWAIIDHFSMAYSGLSVFYVLPKFEMRTTYVQNRINRCVENVKEYKKIIGNGFFDSVAMKNFGRGVVKYVGSNVLSDFKEFPGDVLFVEEVDQCDKDNVEFALDRLRASKYQFKRYLGNPTNKKEGIHKYFLRSDQREWFVPCLQCSKYHELDWFKVIVDEVVDKNGNIINYTLRDTDWFPGCRRDIKCVCPSCGGELERASKRGQWRPANPDSAIEGYHISMLCSPINSISGMWDRFQRAMNDPGLLVQFFNSDLGLPYSAAGNKVTDVLLDRCAEEGFELKIQPDHAHIPHDECDGPCSMGIDVGKILDVRISKLEPRGQRRMVWCGKIRATDRHQLHDLIDQYNVEKCVIDAGPELALALDFQDEAECDVWLCRYGGEGADRHRSYNIADRIITIDRTEALDRSYAQLRRKKNILPKNFRGILNGTYMEEMCMPVRKLEEGPKASDGRKRDNSKFVWTAGEDHQRHCDTYDMLAADLLAESTIEDVAVG